MPTNNPEHLPYSGESAQDRLAYAKYLQDAQRGKTALQLKAVAEQVTAEIRRSWSARSFTAVVTPVGEFDAIVCNISYHFHKHGQKYGTIALYTQAAKAYLTQHQPQAVLTPEGTLKLPQGTYERDGRIITFAG